MLECHQLDMSPLVDCSEVWWYSQVHRNQESTRLWNSWSCEICCGIQWTSSPLWSLLQVGGCLGQSTDCLLCSGVYCPRLLWRTVFVPVYIITQFNIVSIIVGEMNINLPPKLCLKQVEDWVPLPVVLLDLDRMLCSFHWMGKYWGTLYSLFWSTPCWVLSLVMHQMVWWSNGTWCHIYPLLCCHSFQIWMVAHHSTLVHSVEKNIQHTVRLGWCSWWSWLSV